MAVVDRSSLRCVSWSESYFNWLHLGRRIFPEEAIQNVHLFLEHRIWTRHKIKLQLLCSKQPHKDWYAPNKTWCCNSFHYFILAHSREEISSYFHSKNPINFHIECRYMRVSFVLRCFLSATTYFALKTRGQIRGDIVKSSWIGQKIYE